MPQYGAAPTNLLALLRARQSPTNYTNQLGTGGYAPELSAEAIGRSRANAPMNLFDMMGRREDEARIGAADTRQRDELDAIRTAQLGAKMQGFASPQASAQYGRQVEQQKLRQPLEVAKISAETAIDRLLAGQNAQDARTQAQIESREKIAEAGQGTREELASRQVPYQLSRDLRSAREAYRGDVGGPDIFGLGDWLQGVSGKRDAYLASLTDVLRRTGSLDMITQAAQQTVAEGKSADEALAEARAAGVQLDPDEMDALRLFVEQYSRGR